MLRNSFFHFQNNYKGPLNLRLQGILNYNKDRGHLLHIVHIDTYAQARK